MKEAIELLRRRAANEKTGQLSYAMDDIQERHALEEQLRQSQKLEAVGVLVGGVAHDFNNILTAMHGYSTLLLKELKPAGTQKEYIDSLMGLMERAANLTKGLLAFCRNQPMTPKLIDLNAVISAIIRLIGILLGERIAISTRYTTAPVLVVADCGQIEQVIMNLATNARDAMPDGGTLSISTDVVMLTDGNLLLDDEFLPGDYALITVSDTGIGMDEYITARIFEPFFTTKETGRGTGLGLSILYSIIRQHNGFVKLESVPDAGTTFFIYLPLMSSAEADVGSNRCEPVAGGTETILIAEDDSAIRDVFRQLLEHQGYRVLEAADGDEAVAIFRAHISEVNLAIVDMVLPKLGGREVGSILKNMVPEVKMVFTSGYPGESLSAWNQVPECAHFIPKPISSAELLRVVRSMLDCKSVVPEE